MKPPRIFTAKAIDNYTLIIEFTNQEVKKYSILPLLENPIFYPLQEPAFFRNFKIEPGGYAVVWNEDIDLSEYTLWKNSVPATDIDLKSLEQKVEN